MKFTAEISCQETRFDVSTGLEDLGSTNKAHYETANVNVTILLRPHRSKSVPPSTRMLRKVSNPIGSKSDNKRSVGRMSEEEQMELYLMSFGGRPKGCSVSAKDEEETRKKLVKRPSRKVSREGDFLLIQEKIGVLMSQTGAQEIKETRVKIGSEDYYYFLKHGV